MPALGCLNRPIDRLEDRPVVDVRRLGTALGEFNTGIASTDSVATLADAELRHAMGQAARQLALDEFTVEAFVADTLAAYDAVLPKKGVE